LNLKGPVPTGRLTSKSVGRHADGVFGQELVEHGVGLVELQQDRLRVDDLRVLELEDLGQLGAAGPGLLRVGDLAQAEHDVLGRERLAVVELHAVAQPERPLGVVAVRRGGLRHRGLDLVVRVPPQQGLVELHAPGDVRVGHREVRLEGVLQAAAGGAVAVDAAAQLRGVLVRLRRHGTAAREPGETGDARGHAEFEDVAARWPPRVNLSHDANPLGMM
jgi:hypothetical protein